MRTDLLTSSLVPEAAVEVEQELTLGGEVQ